MAISRTASCFQLGVRFPDGTLQTTAATSGVVWNQIGNATGNLTLSNAGFTSTFNQTSAVAWLWKNTTVATVSTTNASPLLEVAANYWTGSASAVDTWTTGSSLAAGANGVSTLNISHSGSTGLASVLVPNLSTTLINSTVANSTATQSNIDTGTATTAIQFTGGTYGAGNLYTPGLVWYTSDNNATKPKAAVYMQNTVTGAQLILGVSGNYATGITQHVVIRPNGGISLGSPANIEGLFQVYGTGMSSATDNTTIGSIRVDDNGSGTWNAIDFGDATTNPTKAMARIAVVKGTSGSAMWFATSNNYATGIINTPLILNYDGTVQIGAQDTGISRLGAASLAIGNGTAANTTGNLSLNTIIKYGGVATVSQGVPSEYATVDLTAQAAAIGSTLLYAVPAASSGMYRISWVATVTTADGVSSVLGGTTGFQITYTDADDSVVKTSPRTVTSGVDTDATNTTATALSGVIVVSAASSANINYQMGYTSATPGQMKFNLHIKLERM